MIASGIVKNLKLNIYTSEVFEREVGIDNTRVLPEMIMNVGANVGRLNTKFED